MRQISLQCFFLSPFFRVALLIISRFIPLFEMDPYVYLPSRFYPPYETPYGLWCVAMLNAFSRGPLSQRVDSKNCGVRLLGGSRFADAGPICPLHVRNNRTEIQMTDKCSLRQAIQTKLRDFLFLFVSFFCGF